jgi:hypothetical protein
MSDPNDSTSTEDGVPFSPKFLEFCAKVRRNDRSILPDTGNYPYIDNPLIIRDLSEKESVELADALLENTNVTYLELDTAKYTKCSAEAMAKYLRTSKCLQRIYWPRNEVKRYEEINSCFMSAFQESTSLKELQIGFPLAGRPSNLKLC